MQTSLSPAEERVVLNGVPWQTFEHLLTVLGDRRGARLTYDRGALEIMSPLYRHENAKRLIGRLIETWTLERNIDMASAGSSTLKREDLGRGVEPDECYYIRNERAVRGLERLDLERDPPPDLVVEVDITSPSTLRMAVYAGLSVPEVWRYDGEKLQVYCLESGVYQTQPESRILPGFPVQSVVELLEVARNLGEGTMIRNFVASIRGT